MYAKYATRWKKRNSRDSGRALSKSFLVDMVCLFPETFSISNANDGCHCAYFG